MSLATASTASSPAASLSFLSSSSSLLPATNKISFSRKKAHHLLSVTCQVSTIPILSFTGEKVGETYLELKTAPPETARAVVHRGIITDLQNKRRGTASTLTRGEVRGGGRKPYSQKKTGNARLGSTRTPLRPGGGVIFGPKPKDWSIKMNRKEKRLAMSTAITSAAVEAGSVLCVEEFGENFEGTTPRTKEFISAMKRWGLDPKEKVMFLLMDVSENVALSSRNIGTLRILTPRTLNLFDVLNSDKLVLTPDAIDYLNGQYGIDSIEEDDEEGDDGGNTESERGDSSSAQ